MDDKYINNFSLNNYHKSYELHELIELQITNHIYLFST